MNPLLLPIVHPAYENLRRSGRSLHFVATVLILIHALFHIGGDNPSKLYVGCLLMIAADIFILVFAGREILTDRPKVNLTFRLIETIFFLAIGMKFIFDNRLLIGSSHVLISFAYAYFFYCEKKILSHEQVGIFHSGINISGIPGDTFLIWTNISEIKANYDSITIQTSIDKKFEFPLRRNLQFEELDQIHEFCRHYLKTS